LEIPEPRLARAEGSPKAPTASASQARQRSTVANRLAPQARNYIASVSLLHEAGIRSGVNLEMGPGLHRAFQDAGLPTPHMRLEMELASDPDFTRWVSDSLRSVLPQVRKLNLSIGALGDLDTLQERLQNEVAISNTVVPWIGLVAAWSRKPEI
jgi:hypothetical protein